MFISHAAKRFGRVNLWTCEQVNLVNRLHIYIRVYVLSVMIFALIRTVTNTLTIPCAARSVRHFTSKFNQSNYNEIEIRNFLIYLENTCEFIRV